MGSFGIDGLGLGGGIDVQGTVAQLLELEAGPIRLLQQQQGRLDAKSAAFTVINTKLNTLSSRIDSLVDISGTFNSKTVTSSNSDLLTASATSQALDYEDVIQGLSKPFVFAVVIALVGCYIGLTTTGGTEGVGRSTTVSAGEKLDQEAPRERRSLAV